MKSFSGVIFIVDLKYQLRINKKVYKSTLERKFVHFWHFRGDLSDHSRTLQKYRGGNLEQVPWHFFSQGYFHREIRIWAQINKNFTTQLMSACLSIFGSFVILPLKETIA